MDNCGSESGNLQQSYRSLRCVVSVGGGGHLTDVDWVPTNLPSGEVGHNIRGKKFAGLCVVPSIGIDHQVDASMSVLSDQVDGLGDRTDEAAQRSAAASRSRFAATAASLRASSQGWIRVFSIAS